VAYAEWRRGLYLLINVLLSNGLGTGYKKILKKYLMTRIITTLQKKKNLLSKNLTVTYTLVQQRRKEGEG
jgi:hypothetical protein